MPTREEENQMILEEKNRLEKQLHDRDAMLCALATHLEMFNGFDTAMNSINWKNAGISRKSFEKWWTAHKEADAERKRREAETPLGRAKAKAEILCNHTDEELFVLGLNVFTSAELHAMGWDKSKPCTVKELIDRVLRK